MISLIDPDTGLAALPEDCYWEVSETTYAYHKAWRMNIMKRNRREWTTKKLFGKDKIHSEETVTKLHGDLVDETDSSGFGISPVAKTLSKANLRYSSLKILARYREIVRDAQIAEQDSERTQKFLGSYPPNSIN